MVTFDKKNKIAYLSAFKPTAKSSTIVITIPKYFADLLDIRAGTQLRISAVSTGDDVGLLCMKTTDAGMWLGDLEPGKQVILGFGQPKEQVENVKQ